MKPHDYNANRARVCVSHTVLLVVLLSLLKRTANAVHEEKEAGIEGLFQSSRELNNCTRAPQRRARDESLPFRALKRDDDDRCVVRRTPYQIELHTQCRTLVHASVSVK